MKINPTLRAVLGLAALMALVTLSLAVFPASAGGPWYVVTTGDDANDCLSPASPCASINGVIGKASAGDAIFVAIGTYTDTGDEVVLLDNDATLSGGWDAAFTSQDGMSTIDGQGSRLGIRVNFGATVTVERFVVQDSSSVWGGILNVGSLTLNDSVISSNIGGGIFNDGGSLTMSNSSVSGNTGSSTGGGIRNCCNGSVVLTNSAVTGNTTGGGGGGIRNEAAMSLFDSTISGNTGRGGGGIFNTFIGVLTLDSSSVTGNNSDADGGGIEIGGGSLTITGSTISNNNTGGLGGGLGVFGGTAALVNSTVSSNVAISGGGIFDNGSLSLRNSTVSGNTATEFGGGIYTFRTVILQNSIVAENTAVIGPDCSGSFISSGYNLLGDTSGCDITPTTGDLTNINPLLGPLQNNGGPTETHALQGGSPAVDAGNPASPGSGGNACLATDQRGIARPQGAACDIGVFELEVIQVVQVTIDIKPGSDTNPINPKSKGVIPVAILTTDDFDATTVDPLSVQFGPDGATKAHGNGHIADSDGDGDLDLVFHFKTQETGIQCSDTQASLTGETFGGQMIEGTDSINAVGCK